MGHHRLGRLHRTRKWLEVSRLLSSSADVSRVASTALDASNEAIRLGMADPVFAEAAWLLTEIPVAARRTDLATELRHIGIDAGDDPTLLSLVSAVQLAIDRRTMAAKGKTDLGEMARHALSESFLRLSDRTRDLFGGSSTQLQQTLSELASPSKFGPFARAFFARLNARLLGYHLSRIVYTHTGPTRYFRNLAHQGAFDDAVRKDCDERSGYLRDFCSEWFTKTRHEKGGISRTAARDFAYGALHKMQEPLAEEVA